MLPLLNQRLLHFCAILFLATGLGSAAWDSAGKDAPDNFPRVLSADLPREARETLQLIRRGGPFPYSRDGVVFSNREKMLPSQPRGYYHEYTVKTPGAKNRGARRIVCGGSAHLTCYYSDDHYQSFRQIKE